MKIVQLLTTMSFGDAVSNDALAIRRLLSEMGHQTRIYAENVDPRLKGENVLPVSQMPALKRDDLLIYHLSTGTEMNFRMHEFRCRRVMIYHNITPPAYFAPYSKASETLCINGLRGMVHLRDAFRLVIADSQFNRQNLLDAGYTCPIEVAPILIPFEDYRQEPDPETVRQYSDGRTNILFVGRIAPNKKHEDVIRAFDCYRKSYDPEARLILVGSDGGMEKYRGRLDAYIRELGAEESVIFPGHISFRQILAFYKTAHVFLCMSEHEGFCVPLAEAMSFDVPIVARDMCAVPETLGGAGILLADGSPEAAAAAIRLVRSDEGLRQRLMEAGRQRLKDFSYEAVGARLKSILGDDLKGAD